MFKYLLRLVIISSSLLLFQHTVWADASVSEVYRAAESGHVREALTMMDQVLKDHPSSGQAHYVEAELLARAGQLDQARRELTQAQQLSPGLPFAKRSAVETLQAQLYSSNMERGSDQHSDGLPWGFIIMIGLLIVSAVLFIRSLRQRALMQPQASVFGGAPPMYGAGYGQGGPMPMSGGGGMGSSILGGLATGAAVGAGMVAGEALANRLMDGHEDHLSSGDMHPDVNQDMGGDNFGLNDSSSWDSGSGGDFGGDMGGGDWS